MLCASHACSIEMKRSDYDRYRCVAFRSPRVGLCAYIGTTKDSHPHPHPSQPPPPALFGPDRRFGSQQNIRDIIKYMN